MPNKDIKITVNGQQEASPEGSSIQDYLKSKGLKPLEVVAELNGEILKPVSFADIFLNDGDNIEFIRFVGGG